MLSLKSHRGGLTVGAEQTGAGVEGSGQTLSPRRTTGSEERPVGFSTEWLLACLAFLSHVSTSQQ